MFRYSFYILIAFLSLMAVLMFAIPLPEKDKRLKGYMLSRRMIALSYVALAVYCYFKGRLELELISPLFLFMANLQAVLLAMSHVNLLHPQLVTTRYVVLHFVPMGVCMVLYGIVRIFIEHVPLVSYSALGENIGRADVIARSIWMAQYVIMYIYYIYLFAREFKRWQGMAADYFADDRYISVKLIRVSLLVVLCIGLITFGITFSLRPVLSAVLNMTILGLYIVMGILFLQYPGLFMQMQNVLYTPAKEESREKEESEGEKEELEMENKWDRIRAAIISQQLYLRPGITLQQIAREVGLSRTVLSNTLNQEEGMNFNSFINRLRIQEAQRLMRSRPELTLQQIAEQVGYAEQSHFHHQFKHWSGKTPREWKKSMGKGV